MREFHYIPALSQDSLKLLPYGRIEEVLRELDSQDYERVGLDRAFYILQDIAANYGSLSGFSFLDIGCNTGLIADVMGVYGNQTVGIDNAIINAQKRYADLAFSAGQESDRLEIDIDDYLLQMEEQNRSFDFILLLSVAHQWEFGYAQTGEGKKEPEQIRKIMDGLLRHTNKAIYYECPIDEPGFAVNYGVAFLRRFLEEYPRLSIVKVRDTVASSGYMRSLYRINRVAAFNESTVATQEFDWDGIRKKYGFQGYSESANCVENIPALLLGEKQMMVKISPKQRTDSHIMGAANTKASPRELWEKVQALGAPYVMPIEAVYDGDGVARVAYVEGAPGQRSVMDPLWQKARRKEDFDAAKQPLTQIKRWLFCLAEGLSSLHAAGIAHGDPFPFNLVLRENEAIWIDLGNISDDPAQIVADGMAFTGVTCQYYLQRCPQISDAMLQKLGEIRVGSERDVCRELAGVFSTEFSDVRAKQPGDSGRIASCLERVICAYSGSFDPGEDNGLILKGLYLYYDEFCRCQLREQMEKTVSFLKGWADYFTQSENIKHRVSADQLAMEKQRHMRELEAEKCRADQLAVEKQQRTQELEAEKRRADQLAVEKQQRTQELEAEKRRADQLTVEKQRCMQELEAEKSRNDELHQTWIQKLRGKTDMDSESISIIAASISAQLSGLSQSRSYRVFRMLRNILKELFSFNLRRMGRCLRNMGKYICGNRQAMSEYYYQDPVVKLLGDANHLVQELEDFGADMVMKSGSSGLPAVADEHEANQSLEADPDTALVLSETQLDGMKFLDFDDLGHDEECPVPKGKRVAYFTNLLLDWDDRRPRFGGGERYCLNLSRLLRKNGFEVDLYQTAPTEFEGDYFGFHVQTIPYGEYYSEFNIDAANRFYEISLDYDYVIYNLPEFSAMKMRPDAIVMCHGIWFDHSNYGGNIKFRQYKWFRFLHNAFSSPRAIISVDTNSINVIRSLWPELAPKMTFIPNFADRSLFFPPEGGRHNDKLAILFPRRSQINRGSRLVGSILEQIPYDVDFYWVGEGDSEDTKLLLALAEKDPRLHYEKASFDEMPDWYRKADIAVIPTIACEGTSLSCIEAMASGCATIATNVGGLTDLIFDGFNGLSADPNAESLAAAINRLIEDEQLRKDLQERGQAYSDNFSIEKWESKWLAVLRKLGWIEEKKTVIVTKNAIHGGVESLIKLEAEHLGADVIVAGGLNNPDGTCPFQYSYVSDYGTLVDKLRQYKSVLYHWPMPWAVQAIRDSGIPSVEFVHRVDTAECDKTVPTEIVSHSQYVCEYINETFHRSCSLVPNVVDTDFYVPAPKAKKEKCIGAVTSYSLKKGIDILVEGWKLIQDEFPDYSFDLYGSGIEERSKFENLAAEIGARIKFNGPTPNSKIVYDRLSLVVSASRIEGLPIALLEALSCNLPILASDIDGHRIINTLCEERGISAPIKLFETENPRAFAEALRAMLRDLEENEEVQTREAALAVFSPEQHIIGLTKALESACRAKRAEKSAGMSHRVGSKKLQANLYCVGKAKLLRKGLPLNVSNEEYMIAECVLEKGLDLVGFASSILMDSASIIYRQADFYDENGQWISCANSGICLDSKVDRMYDLYHIPEGAALVRYVVRPDPGYAVRIDKVESEFYLTC